MRRQSRGYAPKGKTPVLALSQSKRSRINLISAMTNQGTMRFMMHRDTLTAEVLIKFLERLIREAERFWCWTTCVCITAARYGNGSPSTPSRSSCSSCPAIAQNSTRTST